MVIAFECETCGCGPLVEVLSGVTMTSALVNIHKVDNDFVDVDYEDVETDGGEVSCYCCSHCGDPIEDEHGEPINDVEELYKWLEDRDMIEENETE